MEEDQLLKNQKNYYAVLGVSPLATQDEIRAAFRQLSRNIHPDKQPVQVQEFANHCFSEVETAYRVLSDPKLRKAYDLYGIKGVAIIESGAEGLVQADDTLERVEDILRYINRYEFESRAGQSSSFSIGIDLEKLLNQKPPKRSTNLYDQNAFLQKQPMDLLQASPYINNISINQFIEMQASPKDSVLIGGNILRYQNILFSSAACTWKHIIDQSFLTQCTASFGNEKLLHFDLIKALNSSTNGIWSIEYGSQGLGINLKLLKQLNPALIGSLEWGIGSNEGVSFSLENEYEKGKRKLSLYLGEENSGVKASASYYMDQKHTIASQISILADMSNIEVETLIRKDIGQISRANVGVAVGLRGVFLNLRYMRGSMRFLLPIQLSHKFNDYQSIFFGYAVPLSLMGIYYYYTSQFYKSNKEEEKKELKRQKEMIVQSKRMYSQVQINMLEKLAKKQYNIEKENDGLLIVKAVYGDKRYVSYNNETNSSAIVDVTLPCRYLVRNGMLKLYSGTKTDYLGFFNPCVEENAELALYVRYISNGILYEKQIDDIEPLFLPSSTATKIGIANNVE